MRLKAKTTGSNRNSADKGMAVGVGGVFIFSERSSFVVFQSSLKLPVLTFVCRSVMESRENLAWLKTSFVYVSCLLLSYPRMCIYRIYAYLNMFVHLHAYKTNTNSSPPLKVKYGYCSLTVLCHFRSKCRRHVCSMSLPKCKAGRIRYAPPALPAPPGGS